MEKNILPVVLFALSMCITPGPNNVMLTASGIQFGFRRTIPHILGIALGLVLLFILASAGLGTLFSLFPQLKIILKTGGVIYLIIYAVKIAAAGRNDNDASVQSRPLRVYEGLLFQFLNPKALIIIVTGVAAYTASGDEFLESVILLIVVFFFVCIPSVSVWAFSGSIIRRFISSDRIFRICNITLGALTLLSVVMILH